MLDLAPETESRLQQYANSEGVSTDEAVNRLLQYVMPSQSITQRDPRTHVQSLLSQWQQEYGLPVPPGGYKTTDELFAQWDAEDAQLADKQREAEQKFWDDYERERDNRPVQI